MSNTTRRAFLQQSAAGVAAATALVSAPALNAAGANDKIVVGVIGCGGRGKTVAGVLAAIPNVEIGWACDPDETRRGTFASSHKIPADRSVADLRKLLDQKQIDAVLIATPDHWHAPAAILACDAGKHVYVEKPCSHNVREGRLLVDTARRTKRLVQHGTQCRSTGMMIEAVKKLREGVIGTVVGSKVWNIQKRTSIGHQQPENVPAGLDYELWLGPAPFVPYQANRGHGQWHWWYDFGTGDLGNDGVHDIDYGRWGLGVDTHPSLVTAVGGKYFFDDDQQFADMQQLAFEYPGDGKPGNRKFLVYEQRLWSSNYPYNVDSGVEFYGTTGQMFLSRRGKLQVVGDRNQKIDLPIVLQKQDQDSHAANFCDAIRTGAKLNAEVAEGHLSAALCHLGNIATRLGRSLQFNPSTERVLGDEEADRMLSRNYRDGHWAMPREV